MGRGPGRPGAWVWVGPGGPRAWAWVRLGAGSEGLARLGLARGTESREGVECRWGRGGPVRPESGVLGERQSPWRGPPRVRQSPRSSVLGRVGGRGDWTWRDREGADGARRARETAESQGTLYAAECLEGRSAERALLAPLWPRVRSTRNEAESRGASPDPRPSPLRPARSTPRPAEPRLWPKSRMDR